MIHIHDSLNGYVNIDFLAFQLIKTCEATDMCTIKFLATSFVSEILKDKDTTHLPYLGLSKSRVKFKMQLTNMFNVKIQLNLNVNTFYVNCSRKFF